MSTSDLDLIPAEYKQPEGLRTLANYLRGNHGIKVRSGIEHEKRVDYFKGNIFFLFETTQISWHVSIDIVFFT